MLVTAPPVEVLTLAARGQYTSPGSRSASVFGPPRQRGPPRRATGKRKCVAVVFELVQDAIERFNRLADLFVPVIIRGVTADTVRKDNGLRLLVCLQWRWDPAGVSGEVIDVVWVILLDHVVQGQQGLADVIGPANRPIRGH